MTADAVTTAAPAAAAVTIARDGRCELNWFSALCDDDYEQLGVVDGSSRSSLEHCGDIVRTAQRLGFDNVLLPSGESWASTRLPLLRLWHPPSM